MRKPLPSLNALKAFEAAARHNGFLAAADEMNVTPGAISRHVKLLEEHLGVALFRRLAHGVDLTSAGAELQPVLADAFARVDRGLDRVMSRKTELRVICTPTMSIRWLIPRLDRFRRQHPDIDVRLSTSFYGAGGFDPHDNDIGFSVMIWPDRLPDIDAVPLFPTRMTPACTPALAERLGQPKDLSEQTILHGNTPQADWAHWLETFGVSDVDPKRGDMFPNLDMATKAAVIGSGVVMSDVVLCRQELDSGLLVNPFPSLVSDGANGDYCLLVHTRKREAPDVKAFIDWACVEAKSDRTYVQTIRD